jgi:hypothetical protein
MGKMKKARLSKGGNTDILPRIIVEINPKFWYSI